MSYADRIRAAAAAHDWTEITRLAPLLTGEDCEEVASDRATMFFWPGILEIRRRHVEGLWWFSGFGG